jgi:hypothetical protein
MKDMQSSSGEDANYGEDNANIVPPNSDSGELVEDVRTVESLYDSSFRTRPAVPSIEIYDKTPVFSNVDPAMRMDYSRLIGKPFHLKSFPWATTDVKGTELAQSTYVPSDIINLNVMTASPFLLSCLYHMKGCFVVQVLGTPMHGGCLVASVLPRSQQNQGLVTDYGTTLHSYQSAPHAFLHANSATSACIQIPWYSNTKLRMTPRADTFTFAAQSDTLFTNPARDAIDYAQLKFRVLAPLTCPTSASTGVSVSVGIMFTELNFYVPKPEFIPAGLLAAQGTKVPTLSSAVTKVFDGVTSNLKSFSSDILDSGRGWLRSMTGLHNPNITNPEHRMVVSTRNNPNYVDNETFMYKLDPYSTHQQPLGEYISDTAVDEGLISNIVSKPMAVSTFTINTSNSPGTLLFSAPIHPCMFRQRGQNSIAFVTAPIDKLSRMSRFYRGGLRLSIQNLGSSFHMFKLLVTREYYTTAIMQTAHNLMSSVQNVPSEVLEFSAGGQVQHIELKQNSMFDYIPIGPGYYPQTTYHGKVSIYLLQAMVTNGSVAQTADVAVHLSAMPDFGLYGYAVDQFLSNPEGDNAGPPADQPDPDEPFEDPNPTLLMAQSSKVPYNVSNDRILAGSDTTPPDKLDTSPFRPIVHIRDHTRRILPIKPVRFTTTELLTQRGIVVFDVYNLLFGKPAAGTPISLNEAISTMFYGYRGGLKLKFLVRGVADAQIAYIPPGMIPTSAATGFEARSTKPFPSALQPNGIAAFIERFSPTRTTSRFSYAPHLETADFKNVGSPQGLVGADTAAADQGTDTSGATTELEVHVPYMSPLRFVGSYSNHYAGNTDNESSSNDLGTIVLSTQPQYTFANAGDRPAIGPIIVYPFLGTDDVGRFVYQVGSAPIALDVDTFSTGGVIATNYNRNPGNSVGATPTSIYYSGAAAI